jgi:site-specific DNA recombinase
VKRCAIYARYSSDLQSPTSIEDQERLCRAYAERQGWTVVSAFEDAALSGFGIEHRPGYQQLLAAALSSPPTFEIILVEDLSRLTRDMAELLRVTARLRLKGVELVGVSDGIATGRQGAKMHLAVKGLVNELYLDDLRDKTHRGLSGAVARGLSAGGRLYGYRTVPVPREAKPNDRGTPARFEVDEGEAAIVREIFRAYAHGRSMKAIAQDLNQRRIPFPAKDTKRGPWAVSTIRVILRNEKYAGAWVWNKTRFLKDPDSGRRRPVRRPPDEWMRQDRPELRIVEPDLWSAVQRRLVFVAEAFGCRPGRPPRGRAARAYSPYLLSGLLRCALCGARMVGQTFRRQKGSHVYESSWYRCGFATTKGSAVCAHGRGYHRQRLEAAVLARFRAAMTQPMVSTLTEFVNTHVEAVFRERSRGVEDLKTEILRLERQAGNLVRFLAEGGESATVRGELQEIERALQGLRLELAGREAMPSMPPTVHPAWIHAKLERLDALLRKEPAQAKAEIAKHLDGELTVRPLPSTGPERRAEICGRAKLNSLLEGQEAVCAEVVAGAGFEPATFGL